VYGIKSSLQPKGQTSFISFGGAAGQAGPSLTGDQIFVEEGIPGFKTLAGGILRAQGSSYENAKAKALAETKRKFLQTKFRTKKK